MTTSLRPITLEDAQAIVDVRCAIDGNSGLAEDYRHDALEQARGEIADSITYVICSGDDRVGRLRVVRTAACIEIAGLQIHPDRQGRGIGTAVIAEILEESRRTDIPVELYVAKNNPDAERLYDRLGFLRIGEDEKDYRMRHAAATRQR